jgi:hypothetical protein
MISIEFKYRRIPTQESDLRQFTFRAFNDAINESIYDAYYNMADMAEYIRTNSTRIGESVCLLLYDNYIP